MEHFVYTGQMFDAFGFYVKQSHTAHYSLLGMVLFQALVMEIQRYRNVCCAVTH
jgi:hypothetical protein